MTFSLNFEDIVICAVVDFTGIPVLGLRYLKICGYCHQDVDDVLVELLKRCPELCALIIDETVSFVDNLLRAMISYCPNLQVAWFVITGSCDDPVQPKTLGMLEETLSTDGRSLNDFYIATRDIFNIEEFRYEAPLFTFIFEPCQCDFPARFSLSHPYMRAFLGLDF